MPPLPNIPVLGIGSNQAPLTSVIGSPARAQFASGAPFGARSSTGAAPTFGGTPTVGAQVGPTGPQLTGSDATFGSQFGGVVPRGGVTDLPLLTPPLATPQDTAEFNRVTGRSVNQGALRLAQLLGPQLGGIIGDTFTRQQIPFVEARLNFANRQQAELDREAALQLLGFQRSQIGASPEATSAREVALQRLLNPDPISPEEMSLQQSDIRQRGAVGLEDARRSLDQALAAQGLGGSSSAFQQAQLEQQAARQVSSELQRLAIDNALGRDVNEAQAIDRLTGISGEEELRRIALAQALSDILLQERGQFDLSALAA